VGILIKTVVVVVVVGRRWSLDIVAWSHFVVSWSFMNLANFNHSALDREDYFSSMTFSWQVLVLHCVLKLATPLLQTRLIQFLVMDFNKISYTALS